MCVTVNTHPPTSKTRIPASVQSVTFNIPTSPTHVRLKCTSNMRNGLGTGSVGKVGKVAHGEGVRDR